MINTKCISLIGGINSPTSKRAGWSFKRWVGFTHSCFPPSQSRLLHLVYRFKILETELLVLFSFLSLSFLFLFCISFRRIGLENWIVISIRDPEGEMQPPTPLHPTPTLGFRARPRNRRLKFNPSRGAGEGWVFVFFVPLVPRHDQVWNKWNVKVQRARGTLINRSQIS